jgi:hypothetical protein
MKQDHDRGSATVELAVACPALVLLLAASLTGIGAVLTKLRCSDAARDAALAAARGESGESAALRAAPRGATIDLRVEGDLVRVVVRAQPHLFGLGSLGLTVEGEAVAAMEPGE